MNNKLLALYGLKWNPFSPDLPTEAVHVTVKVERFYWRIEQALIREGGFALITGDPGTGKSVALRLLAERLGLLRDISVGAIVHPSGNLADFYREMGDLFGVELKPHNRWGGFKGLRERWLSHLEGTLLRPVLLILLPLGSRIRSRLVMEYADRTELMDCLKHLLSTAGNANLMTPELMQALCDHAVGNYRVLTGMAAELLATAAQRELTQLDEKLYLEVFEPPASMTRKTA